MSKYVVMWVDYPHPEGGDKRIEGIEVLEVRTHVYAYNSLIDGTDVNIHT